MINFKRYLTIALLLSYSTITNANDYLLGQGDVIQISVIQQPDLKLIKKLNAAGQIRFPYVGVVSLANKTEFQAESLLEEKLGKSNYVKAPQVTVRILEHHSSVAYVDGLVEKPGEYPIIGVVTVQQLVARAGGLSKGASSEVSLYRQEQTRKNIDLYDLSAANNNQGANTAVKSGDRIIISAVPVFYTYGAVEQPGRYAYEKDMTVYQALSISEGLTEEASERTITIIRGADSVSIDASLTDKIQPNDVIKVKKSRF